MKHNVTHTLIALSLSVASIGMAHAEPEMGTNFDGCTPAKTMYFAYTADHRKAVEFCEVAGGYRYTYGPVGNPETQFTRKPGEAGVIKTENGARFAIRINDLTYWTSMGRDGSDMLVISKDNWSQGHRLSIIYLESGMGYVNNADKPGKYKAYSY